MEMTNRICLKPLNSSRNKDTSTNFKFPTWKCLPNTLWSSRLSTRLGKVSIILFEKAADHRILRSEFWSHYQFFTEYDEVVQAFNKIRQGKQNSVQKKQLTTEFSQCQQNYGRNSDHNISFLPNMLWLIRLSTRLEKVTDANFVFLKKSREY